MVPRKETCETKENVLNSKCTETWLAEMCRNVPTKKQLEQENVRGKKSQTRIVFLVNEQTPWVVVSMVFYMSPYPWANYSM